MEANQAGKPSSEPTVTPPWERIWNDVKHVVTPKEDTAQPPKAAKLWPWERFWGGKPTPEPDRPAKTPQPAPVEQVPTSLYPSERAMAQAVRFTPAEEDARTVEMKSPAFLNGLREELAKAKDPKIILTLKEEISKFNKRK